MNNYLDKIARILRADKHTLQQLEADLERVTGKVGVLERIGEENEKIVSEKLESLGLSRHPAAIDVYDALISKIESDDLKLFEALNIFSFRLPETSQLIINFVKQLLPPFKGFFLKLEKARQLLIAEPPKKILNALGYKYVDEMLAKEDVLEVFSALRFLEEPEWMNKVFLKQYDSLHPEDFEERLVELKPLGQKWAKAAEKFVAKKYHNVSHLKELGVIFVIPTFLGISGETLRLVSLILHYLNEIRYYSEVFKDLSKNQHHIFTKHLVSILRGSVVEERLPTTLLEVRRPRFLVIQRYLAKDDENDWRLFEPHINPEALHWEKAEAGVANISKALPNFHNGLEFWSNLGWVGDYFKIETGLDALVSFNLVDTVMSLVKQKELIKYLYHHQEALWNKIFIEYFGREKLEKLSRENIIKGWFEI